tara:strand:- start:17613 stop:18314 length:702 start_codon:yes stop_codon:yes gene_type:complete
MKKRSISVFLPTRKGSQRVKHKNTRTFANIEGGLLELKLSQLIKTINIDEVVLSSNDEKSLSIGDRFNKLDSRVKVFERPDELALSSTDLIDLVKYVPTIVNSEHILWTHVTSPFFDESDYAKIIENYFVSLEENYDSLMSVKKFNNYLWDKSEKGLINKLDDRKWPQTQDLKELYEIDSTVFIANRNIYKNDGDRIGSNPKLYISEGLKSFDVDWEQDFELAQYIYMLKQKI